MIDTDIQPVEAVRETNTQVAETEVSVLDLVVMLLEQKRFILRFVAGAMVLAIIVALLLPVRYQAKVVLLPPAQDSSIGSAFLGQLGSLGSLGSLASLASGNLGLKNPADMYVAFLTSRTVEDAMIHRFNLMKEYHAKRMSQARKEFENRTSVLANSKDGLIRITMEDGDPKRAAELANGYVDEFRKLSASLAITEAARRRLFFEQQLQDARNKLTDAENAMTKTEQSTGVLQIDSQARSLIESAAMLRAQVVAKQVQIEGMRSFATDDNPDLILAKNQLAALQARLDQLASSQSDKGSGINLSKGRVTEAGMEYLRRYRDLKYQETIFELLAKEYEVAKLDEAREGSIVQVVDAAVPPDAKSSPHRTLIVAGTTFFACIVAVCWVWLRTRLAHAFALPRNRRRLRVIDELWRTKPKRV